VFVHLCETFFGIPSSISLFRYFFCLKPHAWSDNISPLGGCGIQFRQATTILPGASVTEPNPYVEYVPRPVPRAPRSVSKRARAGDAFTGVSITKKPCQSSTHLGTQVVGSMLLGEHFNILYLLCCLFMSLTKYFLFSQMVL
jgi:hypothetical protein